MISLSAGRLDFEGDHFGFFGGSTRGTGTAMIYAPL